MCYCGRPSQAWKKGYALPVHEKIKAKDITKLGDKIKFIRDEVKKLPKDLQAMATESARACGYFAVGRYRGNSFSIFAVYILTQRFGCVFGAL